MSYQSQRDPIEKAVYAAKCAAIFVAVWAVIVFAAIGLLYTLGELPAK